MIRRLTSPDAGRDLVRDINSDPDFSAPMLSTAEQIECTLIGAFEKPDHHVLGVFTDDVMTGLFVFLILEDDRYMEMTVGLSRSARAYEELFAYLSERYPGFRGDFVFNPGNHILRALLVQRDALFYCEQQKMVFRGPCPAVETSGVKPLSARYRAQYAQMHSRDVYWTGERVMEAPERFSVLVAVQDRTVVGYIDVTNCYEENEPFDIRVREPYRGKGWGKKLLAAAIKRNGSKGMGLLVDTDNVPAIKLYKWAGFVKAPGQNSITAVWDIR